MYDCPVDPTAGYVLAALVAGAVLYIPAAVLCSRAEGWLRAVCAAAAAVRAPRLAVRLAAAVRRVRLAAWAFVVARSERAFRYEVERRAKAEVHSGLTLFEEWSREAEALPRAARLALRGELARVRPGPRAFESARRRCGSRRLVFGFRRVSY